MNTITPDEDEPNFEIPGIDDCDFLFSASDGDSTVYIRVQEHPHEAGVFYGTATIDCESGGFVDDLETMAGPFDSPEDACRRLSRNFDWFCDNSTEEVEFCDETKKALGL